MIKRKKEVFLSLSLSLGGNIIGETYTLPGMPSNAALSYGLGGTPQNNELNQIHGVIILIIHIEFY